MKILKSIGRLNWDGLLDALLFSSSIIFGGLLIVLCGLLEEWHK